MEFQQEAEESTTGPASFIAVDPDGNPILVDQHVSRNVAVLANGRILSSSDTTSQYDDRDSLTWTHCHDDTGSPKRDADHDHADLRG